MKKAEWIWLSLFLVAIPAALSPSSAWALPCGDNLPPGSDTPCACGDTVVTDTLLKASDPVTRVTCGPMNSGPDRIALSVAAGVTLDMSSPSVRIRCGMGVMGIAILGPDVTIDGGSSIIDGCHPGVHIPVGSDAARIDRLVVRKSMGTSFLVEGDQTTLVRNLCDDTQGGAGIAVLGDGNVLDANYCQGSKGNGILVLGNDNTLTRNLCRNNEQHGIHVTMGTGNVLEGNLCQGNVMDGIVVATGGNTLNRNQARANGGSGVVSPPHVVNKTDLRNYGNGNRGQFQCQINGKSSKNGKYC